MNSHTGFVAIPALIGVLILIAVLTRFLRAAGWATAAGSGRTLILRETIALDARRRVHLVQHADRHVLLLTGGSQDLVIGWIPDR